MTISLSSQVRQQLELHARTLGLHPAPGESDLDLALRVALVADGLDEDDPLHIAEQFTGADWTQSDGTTIAVREMTDSHLRNAIRMLERKGAKGEVWDRVLRDEVDRRRKLGPPEILCSRCGDPLRQLEDCFVCDPCGRTVDGITYDF
jgi:hypothetical protein